MSKGRELMLQNKVWQFNHEVAPHFDEHVRQSVPGYQRIQESVVSLTDFFCVDGSTVLDLGCATGETLHLMNQRLKDKEISLIGVDESHEMIQQAMRKTLGNPEYTFLCMRLEDYKFPKSTSVVTSILTMQFVNKHYRKLLLNKVYESLEEGGAFIFVEKSHAGTAQMQEMFTQLYHDFKEEQGLEAEAIRLKDKSLRGVMKPNTFVENEEMLRRTGFKEVELFFKDLHFAGWIAVK